MIIDTFFIESLFILVVVLLLTCYFLFSKRMKSEGDKPGKDLTTIATKAKISQLWIYPIKSCSGIKVGSAKLHNTGLENDRQWLFVNEESGDFVTQRSHPRLSLVHPKLVFDCDNELKGLDITATGMEYIHVPLLRYENKDSMKRSVTVWDSVMDGAVDQGDTIAKWIVKHLNNVEEGETTTTKSAVSSETRTSIRLVYCDHKNGGSSLQPIDSRYRVSNKDATAYADGYPILLTTEEGLDFMNSKLSKPVTWRRFRPNIVVKSADKSKAIAPFDEDYWRTVCVKNSINLHGVKKCSRCLMPTVDPDTGVIGNTRSEIYKIMLKYRRLVAKGDVYVGMNIIPEEHDNNRNNKGSSCTTRSSSRRRSEADSLRFISVGDTVDVTCIGMI